MGKDQRLHPRAIVRLKARILEPGRDEWSEALLFDLSAGGAALHTGQRVPIQSEVRLEFTLPAEPGAEDHPVGVTCLVVRSAPLGRASRGSTFLAALHFLDLPAPDFDRIRVYIWSLLPSETGA